MSLVQMRFKWEQKKHTKEKLKDELNDVIDSIRKYENIVYCP